MANTAPSCHADGGGIYTNALLTAARWCRCLAIAIGMTRRGVCPIGNHKIGDEGPPIVVKEQCCQQMKNLGNDELPASRFAYFEPAPKY